MAACPLYSQGDRKKIVLLKNSMRGSSLTNDIIEFVKCYER